MAQVQSSSTAPIPTEYGGDEVSALVLDPGYATTRAGFAGEDVPKSVIPSYYALADKSTNPLFGDNAIHTPQGGLSIHNPMSKDGTVEDWETASKLWEYAITSRLTNAKPSNPATNGLNDPENGDEMEVEMEALDENEKSLEEHPLLLTETGWNSARAREKSIQIAMEDWGCPAFWMARSGVLAAFAQGKASALVIDVGASNIAITPIHDGLLLRKGVVRSPLAGNWLSQQVRLMFASSQPPVPLTPHYLITSKSPVDAGAPASATYRTFAQPPTPSFRALQEERVLTEFKESVVQLWSGPHRLSSQSPQAGISNEELLRSQPGKPFEMPDGWNQVFGVERYKVVEGMFDAKAAYSDSEHPAPTAAQTLPALLRESLNAVDVDARGHMLGNVVVTGAASQLVGFVERLNAELSAMFPGMRVKVVAPGMSIERRFGSWIGGSILGSLGTFHQMWISKKEYEDHGAGIVEKRCK